MDFRAVQPSQVTWTTWSRGQPAARTPQGGKVVVQTPPCAVRVSMPSPGMYRLDMQLRPDVEIHQAFSEWLADIEDAVAGADALKAWRGAKSRSTTVYNGNLRLTAFSDTLAFDATGALSADLMSAAGATCLVELQGCWSSEARWGLRWRVVQVKFSREPPPLPIAPAAFVDDDDPPAAQAAGGGGGAYAFLD